MMKYLFAILCIAVIANAHMCLVSPHQRGKVDIDINTPGSNDCVLTSGPCGDARPSRTVGTFSGTMTVAFQKNLDHWYKNAPGNFTVAIADSPTGNFTPLKVLPDTDSDSLTFYFEKILLPNKNIDHAVLQVVYYTNNPGAPAAFYQCADISVSAGI
eukprot:TRINITY_DN3634_c0_g1_i1.p1 TRINITY_DN3634_c0_g1~~TRINITY_DN3634_c0_g1_i1.p1  ORF type:complete len:157 (-),score=32.21 TRINITY_DN3634_c0_g1_i1:36-506(-)